MMRKTKNREDRFPHDAEEQIWFKIAFRILRKINRIKNGFPHDAEMKFDQDFLKILVDFQRLKSEFLKMRHKIGRAEMIF